MSFLLIHHNANEWALSKLNGSISSNDTHWIQRIVTMQFTNGSLKFASRLDTVWFANAVFTRRTFAEWPTQTLTLHSQARNFIKLPSICICVSRINQP